MAEATQKSYYWTGFRAGVPFVLVVMPFGLLFGVVATEAGFTSLQTMAFSSVVFAGAAQFAALQLMVDNAPMAIVIATALAVNLRMAMYSASLSLWLGDAPLWKRALIAYVNVDQSYAISINKYEDEPQMILPDRIAFFFGAVTPVCPLWIVATGLGIWLGDGIPDWMALDFAVPICFLAIIAPMMRTLAHMVAAVTSIVVALVLAGLPFNLGLLVAAVLAMVIGAQVELWTERRAKA
ncbi:AzlC family ABC transporter permease [Octadecabacter sp. 1_MG-2023]|uniref:AzlC family ABC transporter permease n=1 Tax=unclassified Octadecabacter TaxID=196158 RepID=UPI001C09EBFF|nr:MULTISPECIES: AzlC family ABC transporter permease [unclassified Octadecabacter]MBU2994151.1 AzlC family ABC transporter permease [Octadecabacter sp. B2R22]MDO6734560.1 AzlC family ABC transporter permease [Octadecabacter sp. 1_MG-2023]